MPCGGGADYDDVAKACRCPAGSRAVEYDAAGTPLESIQCEICPPGEYRGPAAGSVWECAACPHFAMAYNEAGTPWQCECDTDAGWVSAGGSCVLARLRDELAGEGRLGAAATRMTYRSVDGRSGEPDGLTHPSDVYRWLYVKSALGCRAHDP